MAVLFSNSLVFAQVETIDTLDVFQSAKLLVTTDYFDLQEFDELTCLPISFEKMSCHLLESKNFDNILFIKVEYRELEYLKLIFQVRILNKPIVFEQGFSDSLYKSYFEEMFPISLIDDTAFYEEKLGYENFMNNSIHYQGDFILAYAGSRFYRLRGFRVNDFYEFCLNIVSNTLYTGSWQKNYRGYKKRTKKRLGYLAVEELDFEYLYDNYIKKDGGMRGFNAAYRSRVFTFY